MPGHIRSAASRKLSLRAYDSYFMLAGFTLFAALLSDKFFTSVNMSNFLKQNSALGIVAIGELCVILTGGIDLSVGAITSMSSIVTAMVLRENGAWPIAIMAGMGIGLLAGTVNGAIIAFGHLPPFIVTLAGMSIFSGVGQLLSTGRQVFYENDTFVTFGENGLGFVPLIAMVWFSVAIIFVIFLRKTTAGRYIRGIGGNKEAVMLAGVRVKNYETLSYSLAGLLSGFAGVIMASRLTLGSNIVAQGWESIAIAAVIVGGGSFIGGIGSIGGTIVGCFIMALIGNIMNLIGVSIFWQQIIRGMIILVAVFTSTRRAKA